MSLLESLAAQAPTKDAHMGRPVNGNRPTGDSFAWLDSFLDRNAGKLPPMSGPDAYQGGRRWTFDPCPWNPDHIGGSAFLIQRADGTIQAGCRHNSCQQNNWQSLRAMIEPVRKAPLSPRPHPLAADETPGKLENREVSSALPRVAFPISTLPPVLRRFAVGSAEAAGVPSEVVILPALAVLAAAVGSARRVWINPSWAEPMVLWTALLIESGEQKTTGFKLAIAPTRILQAKAEVEYQDRLSRYELDLAKFESDLTGWKKNKCMGDPPAKPQPPTPVDYFTSNCTIEAMVMMQKANPRGVPYLRDELSGFLSSFGEYKGGAGSDESNRLEMYNGGTIKNDRASGKRAFVPDAYCSIGGTVQPKVFARLIKGGKKIDANQIDNGMCARFMIGRPRMPVKTWRDGTMPPGITEAYADLVTQLNMIPLEVDSFGRPKPRDIPMTGDAQQRFARFVNEHGQEKARIDDPAMRFHWSKLEGGAARVALLLQLCADPESSQVQLAAVEDGIRVIEWFKAQARIVYGELSESPVEQLQRELVESIQRRGGSITARELARNCRRYPDAEAAEKALRELVELGIGHWEEVSPGPAGGRPARIFTLGNEGSAAADETPEFSNNIEVTSARAPDCAPPAADDRPPISALTDDDRDWGGGLSEFVEAPALVSPDAKVVAP